MGGRRSVRGCATLKTGLALVICAEIVGSLSRLFFLPVRLQLQGGHDSGTIGTLAQSTLQLHASRHSALSKRAPIRQARQAYLGWDTVASRMSQGWEVFLQDRALGLWNKLTNIDDEIIYRLLREPLDTFVPGFDPPSQIQAHPILKKFVRFRNLTVSPVALSVLTGLAPAGLNFTDFWINEVSVEWRSLLALDRFPLVFSIDVIRATAEEVPVGNSSDIEELVARWIKVTNAGVPTPLNDRYPLLDGATINIKSVELNISSPTRYGNLSICLDGVRMLAVNEAGQPQDLDALHKDGLGDDIFRQSKLIEFQSASVSYLDIPDGEFTDHANGSLDTSMRSGSRAGLLDTQQYLFAPMRVVALQTMGKLVTDMRLMVSQKWSLSLFGPLMISSLPPLLSPQPESQPRDPRLFPFTAPPAQWEIRSFATKSAPTSMLPHAARPKRVFETFFVSVAVLAVATAVAFYPRKWALIAIARFQKLF